MSTLTHSKEINPSSSNKNFFNIVVNFNNKEVVVDNGFTKQICSCQYILGLGFLMFATCVVEKTLSNLCEVSSVPVFGTWISVTLRKEVL